MAKDKKMSIIVTAFGAVVIFLISSFSGFSSTFLEMLGHLKADFTTGLIIHIYILGWILLAYGVVKYFK